MIESNESFEVDECCRDGTSTTLVLNSVGLVHTVVERSVCTLLQKHVMLAVGRQNILVHHAAMGMVPGSWQVRGSWRESEHELMS